MSQGRNGRKSRSEEKMHVISFLAGVTWWPVSRNRFPRETGERKADCDYCYCWKTACFGTFGHGSFIGSTVQDHPVRMKDDDLLPHGGGSSDKDDEESLTIPRAAMNKLIKELVPDIRVATESRDLILQCCTEFIHLITNKANTICEEEKKKTMSAEHVLEALDQLGFSSYKSEAESVVSDCKNKRRRQSTRLEHLGIPEEELLRQQEELFAKAKAEQARADQEEWLQMQAAALAQSTLNCNSSTNHSNFGDSISHGEMAASTNNSNSVGVSSNSADEYD